MNQKSIMIIPSCDPSDLSQYQINVGGICLTLAEFLTYCAASLKEKPFSGLVDQELIPLRDAFLDAGLTAMKTIIQPLRWLQAGLAVADDSSLLLLCSLTAEVVRELLRAGSITNFFFLHKPPGFRLRFELAENDNANIRGVLRQRLADWTDKGILVKIVPGVYEPENHLFGGPTSMRVVHKLFTIDSLAWLDFHACSCKDDEDIEPAWALSLVMLRSLFFELGVSGWEDIDVWDRVRRQTGRKLPTELLSQKDVSSIAAEIRTQWNHFGRLQEKLSPNIRLIAEEFGAAVGPLAETWRSEYFNTTEAYLGLRDALAFFIIFHWNRAGLSLTRQALMAESLAEREK